jgi:hypothetical protein
MSCTLASYAQTRLHSHAHVRPRTRAGELCAHQVNVRQPASATGLGSPPPTSARGPCAGSGRHARQTRRVRLARLCRDWAHPCHICTGNGLGPATSAPGLGAPLPHEDRDWGSPLPTSAPGLRPTTAYHICAGTGLTADHISIGTGLTPPTFAPRLCAVQARSSYSQLGYSHLVSSRLGHSHLGHSHLGTSRGAGPPMFGSHQSQRRP